LGDRYDELCAQPLAKARGHDEAPLVVQGALRSTRKPRDLACQGKTSTLLHPLPLCTTIPGPSTGCKGASLTATTRSQLELREAGGGPGRGAKKDAT
jgi:hypothetical protein